MIAILEVRPVFFKTTVKNVAYDPFFMTNVIPEDRQGVQTSSMMVLRLSVVPKFREGCAERLNSQKLSFFKPIDRKSKVVEHI